MEDTNYQKSYFDVLAICCSSEVPLIVNMLSSLDGVQDVKVIVPSRTVIVIHDNLLISDIQIVKVLNQARLEANIRVYGQEKHGKKWPKPYTIVCGILVAVSTFKFIYHPLVWIALGAIVIGIKPILFRSVVAVRNCTFDVNILGLIAVGGCCGLRDFWEGGTIVFLYTIAEWLQSRASHKANVEMSSLMSTPQKAILAETGETIAAKDIVIDTILAVKAGEVIPIDGVVVEGNCEVDEKTLTGESLPVPKQVQSIVWAGTINLNGYISVKTTALAEDCIVAKMAKLVEEAQNSKSKTQRLVDKFAKYYTPAVLLAAIGLIVVPAALGKHNLKHWARLALVILVSACPCALILSTPVATFCAFTKAATSGILIKGGDYLEVLADIKVMAFDKTGTLTRGEFSVSDFRSIQPDVDLNTLLYWVSSIESKASHPMAVALVDYGRSKSLEPKPENVKEYQDFPGEGIYGEIDGKCIYVGNKKIAIRAGCETVPSQGDGDEKGETFGYIFSGENLLGVFSMADTCRSGVQEAITELKSLGIKTTMLTGDSYTAAMRVQAKLGNALDEVHAELLPEEKVKIIKDLKKKGPTAMIGDGVNDAPALATAHIGISMGIAGSAMAIETGQITLMSNDIRKIPQAIRLARRTRLKIRQNMVLSFVTKAAVLTLAFCGYPFLWAAVLVDVGTCLLVIFNSMLLLQGTTTHRVKCHKFACAPDNTGHGSHIGCGHDKHGCGTKGTNNLHSSTVNHIHKRSCSHGDPPSVCGHKKDHQTCTPRSPCRTANPGLCGKSNVSLAKCNGHRGCSTDSHERPSLVIQINKVNNKVDTCKNHSNDEHSVCTNQVDTPYHCSNISQQTKNACQGHSCSVSSETNNLDEDQSLKEVCEGHRDHSCEDQSLKEVCHQQPCHALNKDIKTTTLNGAGCLHNQDRHVDCQAEASMFNESNNCIMGMCCEELNKVMHTCASLEKRGSSDCCSKSFRRECGGMHGSATGVLTEIITE